MRVGSVAGVQPGSCASARYAVRRSWWRALSQDPRAAIRFFVGEGEALEPDVVVLNEAEGHAPGATRGPWAF